MRHQKKTLKLGLTAAHRKALLANQVCSLIEHQRIKTTLAKAKAVRPLAEKMVTLGKKGSLHARRTALAVLLLAGEANPAIVGAIREDNPAHPPMYLPAGQPAPRGIRTLPDREPAELLDLLLRELES